MKLEVGNHEVRNSNELPGLPYISLFPFKDKNIAAPVNI